MKNKSFSNLSVSKKVYDAIKYNVKIWKAVNCEHSPQSKLKDRMDSSGRGGVKKGTETNGEMPYLLSEI